MNNRIRKLRKELDLTQKEFGAKIGVKGNTIAQYEIGRNEPVDAVISLICKVDWSGNRVNEAWLRTGEGNMFVPAPSDALDALAKEYNMDETERAFFEEYLRLDDAERSAVSNFLRKVCKPEPPADPEPPVDLSHLSIDEKVALYRQELEREEKVEARLSASQRGA